MEHIADAVGSDPAAPEHASIVVLDDDHVRRRRFRSLSGFLPGIVLIVAGVIGLGVYVVHEATRHTPGPSLDGRALATNLAIGAARTGLHVTLTCPSRIPERKGYRFTCTAKTGGTTRIVNFEEANDKGVLTYSGLFAPQAPPAGSQTTHPTASP